MNEDNPMRKPRIVKCVVNIGVGSGGEKQVKAKKVLNMLTGQEPVDTISKTTNADLGIRKGQTIGCKVTLRGKKAYNFLKKAFWVTSDRILEENFDDNGNFSFGIDDYTDFENQKYNPNIGIFGLDISVELARKGERIKRRKKKTKKIPHHQKLTKEEAIDYVEKAFGVEAI
ncbi:MAG: 50S ribosomal protein L5 [Thermoplasmatota archaeon]